MSVKNRAAMHGCHLTGDRDKRLKKEMRELLMNTLYTKYYLYSWPVNAALVKPQGYQL